MAETNRIVSAVGWENIKNAGETVKQVTEALKVFNESKEMLSKLLQANDPISRSIAQSLDAQTLKTLKEGDVTALQELKGKIEQDKGKLEEVNTALVEENKQLKEALQTKTTQEIIREEFDKRFPAGRNPGGEDNLLKAVNNLVAERLDGLLRGNTGGSTLSSEDIKRVVGEEVVKATQGNKPADQVADDIVKMLSVGDTIRQKLGIGQADVHNLIGQGSNLRSDLVQVILNHDVAILKANQEYDTQREKAKHLGVLAGAVKDNIEDIAGACRDMVRGNRESEGETESKGSSESTGFQAKCTFCNAVFSLPVKPSGAFNCPKCNRELRLGETGAGVGINCSLCHQDFFLPEMPTGPFECPKCHGQLTLGGEKPPELKPSQFTPASSFDL